jgi:hypothetical protein
MQAPEDSVDIRMVLADWMINHQSNRSDPALPPSCHAKDSLPQPLPGWQKEPHILYFWCLSCKMALLPKGMKICKHLLQSAGKRLYLQLFDAAIISKKVTHSCGLMMVLAFGLFPLRVTRFVLYGAAGVVRR